MNLVMCCNKQLRNIKTIKNTDENNLKIIKSSINEDLLPSEVLIEIKYVGLNHRDLHAIKNFSNFIIGSDAVGLIKKVGCHVSDFKINDEVIINPVTNWEYSSEPPKTPNIIGGPSNGVLSEYIKINQELVFLKPQHLSLKEASALPLAGLTAYRNLFTKGQLKEKQIILITGVSGSVALLMAQMAKMLNCTVIGTSRTDNQKIKYIDKIINTNSDFKKESRIPNIDLILDSLGGSLFHKYIDIIKANGNIVSFGNSTEQDIKISTRDIFYYQINILGTSVGSKEEFRNMLDFVNKYNITPIVEHIFPFNNSLQAIELLKSKKYKGSIVIEV
ncbi:zinc-binding dehydrogenase [Staphylococcus epidermidis]|nr:zinc-binding dehydrogenase [Staphylococcus epidermidis]